MSCICRGQYSGFQIQDPKPYRNKHLLPVVGTDLPVGQLQDFLRAMSHQGIVLYQDLGYHHEQRRRNTLSGHIGHDHSQTLVVDQKEIIKITTHFLCRIHGCIDIELLSLGESGEDIGKCIRLDPGRHGKLRFQPRILFLLHLVFLCLITYDNVIEKGCRYNGGKDDKLHARDKDLDDDGNNRRNDIKPECGCHTTAEFLPMADQQCHILNKHQGLHQVGKRISGRTVIDILLIKIVVHIRELRHSQEQNMQDQQNQEPCTDDLRGLPGIRYKKDQEGDQVCHKSGHKKLDIRHGMDGDIGSASRPSFQQHPC